MNPIDPELQKYYDNYLDLFSTPGWAQFIEDLQGSLLQKQTTAAARCPSGDQWLEERGSQVQIQRVLGFEDQMRRSLEVLQNPEEDMATEDEYSLDAE